jgi:hypothetical protein
MWLGSKYEHHAQEGLWLPGWRPLDSGFMVLGVGW